MWGTHAAFVFSEPTIDWAACVFIRPGSGTDLLLILVTQNYSRTTCMEWDTDPGLGSTQILDKVVDRSRLPPDVKVGNINWSNYAPSMRIAPGTATVPCMWPQTFVPRSICPITIDHHRYLSSFKMRRGFWKSIHPCHHCLSYQLLCHHPYKALTLENLNTNVSTKIAY